MLCRLLLISVLFLSFSNLLSAQDAYTVKGSIVDSTLTAVVGANVLLLTGKDTLRFKTDNNGQFRFNDVRSSQFSIVVTYIGYKDVRIDHGGKTEVMDISFGQIKLSVNARQLEEVSIKSKIQPIIFKKDTTEYDVASYGINDREVVEELLKKLPGIEVDRAGNVTSEGKPVTKLRVNGEDFFTGSVQELIRQLPVGILKKLQIVNDYGDDAAFTGIKKGQSTKQINLVTKPGMNNGIFGNINASAGNNGVIGTTANANLWKENKQISSAADLKTASNIQGSNIYNKVILSYNDRFSKSLKFSAGYNFNSSRASVVNNTFSESVNTSGNIDNSLNSSAFVRNSIHAFNFSSKYEPGIKTYAKLASDLSFNNSSDTSYLNSQQTGLIKQGLIARSAGDTKTPRGNVELTIGRKFGKERRLATANFQYHNNNGTTRSTVNRIISYYNFQGSFTKDSIYNTIITNTSRLESLDATFVYSEPLGKKSSIEINYVYSVTKQRSALATDVNLIPGGFVRIDSLTNNFYNTLYNQRVDLNYNLYGDKLTMSEGASLQRNRLSGLYRGRAGEVSQATFNFSPILSLAYAPSSTENYDLKYTGYSEPPSVDELQPVQDTRDIQNIIVGNPQLKPSFTHQIDLNIRHFGLKSNQSVFLGIIAAYRQNEIISNTAIVIDSLNSPKQITSFLNADGGYSAGSNYDWSLPTKIWKLKLKTSYSGNLTFARQILFANGIKAFNNSSSISQTIRSTATFKYLDIESSVNYSTVSNRYTVGEGFTNRISRYVFSLIGNFRLKSNTTLGVDANKSIVKGYSNIASNNPLIINASLGQIFLKNKLTLRLQGTDILNQSSRITQIVSGNTIISNKANYLTRYFILSINFNLSRFGTIK